MMMNKRGKSSLSLSLVILCLWTYYYYYYYYYDYDKTTNATSGGTLITIVEGYVMPLSLSRRIEVTDLGGQSSSNVKNCLWFEKTPKLQVSSSSPLGKQNRLLQIHPTTLSSSTACNMIAVGNAVGASKGTHYLVRILYLRGLALVYCAAFWAAYRQNKALIGDNGLTPARYILEDAKERGRLKRKRRNEWFTLQRPNFQSFQNQENEQKLVIHNKISNALHNSTTYQNIREVLWDRSDRLGRPLPTLLWIPFRKYNDKNESSSMPTRLDPWLDAIAITGLFTSLIILVLGTANVPLILTLYTCQRSIMSVGGIWYGYGWEPQLAELTFHTLFLVPLLSWRKITSLSSEAGVSPIVLWTIRWFLFRIMMGAGLIKLRSNDVKWKNLSTMDYFYETQPVPNPLSKWYHSTPKLWHRFEVLINHFVEIIAPWFLLSPFRNARIKAAVIQLLFQCTLVTAGNLSFLNWLTMLPALMCLDDAFVLKRLSWIFRPQTIMYASVATYNTPPFWYRLSQLRPPDFRAWVDVLFGILIAKLSIPVVQNLCSKKQVMNASFDPLRLVNTYGAFGTVSEERIELVIETAAHYSGPWKEEFEFKVKPGNIYRRPKFISPYHHRLDWQMWLVATTSSSIDRHPWMYNFLLKLLQQDKDVLNLLEKSNKSTGSNKSNGNMNEDANHNDDDRSTLSSFEYKPPKYIRVQKYRYKFNYPQKNINDGDNDIENRNKMSDENEPYWTREKIDTFFPRQGICTAEMLEEKINHRSNGK